ncbi:MAG: GHKL domain-containing protein [Lactobacillus delbrueckii]|jgi:two-component system sensor histidine kinase AgrC
MQDIIIYLTTIILSALFDLYLVNLLGGVKIERRQLLVVSSVLVLATIIALYDVWATFLANLSEALFFYKYFSKSNKLLLLNSLLLAFFTDIFLDSIDNLLESSFAGYSQIFSLGMSLLAYFLIIIAIQKNRERLIKNFTSKKTGQPLFCLLVYLYVSTFLLNLAVLYNKWFYSPTITLSVLIVIQTLFAVIMFWFDFHIQKGLLNQQEEELREKYLQDLEASEDKVREFKHDYLNLLASLRESAQSSRDKALLEELADYSDTEINDPKLWKYKSLNHINNHALKGLIIDKLDRMNARKISYSLECAQEITDLPAEVKIFDLIRVIGIALDNAIEESELLLQETGDAGRVRIDIMLYQAQPQELEFVVKNRCSQGNKIKLNEIGQKGTSSKTGHKGYGLANVHEIQEKYENMFVEYGVSDDYFTFSMAVS